VSGLALLFDRRSNSLDARRLDRLAQTIHYRGIDGERRLCRGPVGLAHAHFWTTPEEVGERQPLESADGRYWLAMDGRLDNRDELRAALAARRASVPGAASDATLVLAAWETWGDEALRRLRGPLAFVLADHRGPAVHLARDVLGGRGLAYALSPSWLAVASDDFGVLAAPEVGAELDPARLASFFAIGEPAAGTTFFRSIRQVLPGERITIGATDSRRTRFDAIVPREPGARRHPADLADLAEELRHRLDTAVARRLRTSPQPPLVLASGGLDSSAIAALAAAAGGDAQRALRSLSWNFNTLPDERHYQAALAEHLGLRHQRLYLDDKVPLAELELWPIHPSTPEQNPYRLLHQAAYEATRASGSRVLLSGLMGDQLFTGWETLAVDLARSGQWVAALRAARAIAAEMGWRAALAPRLRHHPRLRARREPPEWLTSEAARLVDHGPEWPPEMRRAGRPRQWLRTLGFEPAHGFAVEAWYTHGAGIEVRYPFRDRELVEFLLNDVPTGELWQPGEARPVLRRALRPLLPPTIVDRTDKGTFEPLFRRVLEPPVRATFEDLFLAHDNEWHRYVRRDWLEGAFRRGAPRPIELLLLWSATCFELWRRRRTV
jgi:asparagine synthase (glutamine-hydrolysing)